MRWSVRAVNRFKNDRGSVIVPRVKEIMEIERSRTG